MHIILGSASPRRRDLLLAEGLSFQIKAINCNEEFGATPTHDVAKYLADKKSKAYGSLNDDEILITADTTVVFEHEIYNKPVDRDDAIRMLSKLSGNRHEVITGVCIRSANKTILFDDITSVVFRQLTEDEICTYIDNFSPYDKAGSYGIQDWMGEHGVQSIEGDYNNVVGLPSQRVLATLKSEFNLP